MKGKRNSTERVIALALATNGRTNLTRQEVLRWARYFEVTDRSIYRYLDKIARATFLLPKDTEP